MAYSSYSGPLKNPFNDINNEDDEFGDFTSAVTYPTIGSCNGETGFQVSLPVHPPITKMPTNSVFFNPIPDNSDIDDEFGDFCGPTVAHATEFSMVVPATPDSNSNMSLPLEGSLKKCQPNYDIDLEEDITGVSQLSWISQKEEENGIVDTEEEEEEFTNFTSAEPVNCPPLSINSVFSPSQPIVEELFSTLGDVSLPPILQPLDHQLTNSKMDDDFGDFTQASTVVAAEINHQPVVEDLFSLDAVPPLDSPGVTSSYDCFDQQDELEQPHFAAMDSPQINWDEPLETVGDPLSATVCFDEDDKTFDENVEEEFNQEEDEFVFHQNVETAPPPPDPEFSDFQTEPIDAPVDDGEIEEFGDFTDFQTATAEAVLSEDDDEFDDFEAAPQPSADSAAPVVELSAATPETHIQRMLTTLFPVNSAPSTDCEPSTIPLTNSPGGSLWSYISQVDSTPALSFSWRHSAAQQRFLHSLRIDSVLQAGNTGSFRWNSPSSVNSPSASMTESFTESTVTLDLDFFLNPSSSSTSSSATAVTTTSDSILETIERELLSPKGLGNNQNQGVAPPVQSPPVRHTNHQLSDIFQHLHLQQENSSVTNRQVDLLQ